MYNRYFRLLVLVISFIVINSKVVGLDYRDELVNEAKNLGIDVDSEKLYYLLFRDRQFVDPAKASKYLFLQLKISYWNITKKAATASNLTASISNPGNVSEQYAAFLVLNSDEMGSFVIDVSSLKKILEESDSEDIKGECIALVTRFDRNEGFKEADKFMTNDVYSLKSKVKLNIGLMKYEYTGGYGILKEILLNNPSVSPAKYSIPILLDYYRTHDGEKATGSEEVINIRSLLSGIKAFQ